MNEIPEPPRPDTDSLITGVLIEHGPARFELRENGAPSYYVKVQTAWGLRTVWGSGIEKALERSKTKPQIGEPIGIRENGTAQLIVGPSKLSPKSYATPRGRWVVERREWFDERLAAAKTLRDERINAHRAVKDHPELLGAYMVLGRAITVVRERVRSPEHRRKFASMVREALARTAEIGDPLPYARPRDQVLMVADAPRDKDAPVR